MKNTFLYIAFAFLLSFSAKAQQAPEGLPDKDLASFFLVCFIGIDKLEFNN